MNNKPNPDRSLLHFMLRAQQIAQQDGRSDKGYAMLIVSLVSIAMFSMLAAYTTITNLSKSSTKAYVDGTNTFYVAEAGLNRRAAEVREKFVSFATPSGLSPGQATQTTFVSSANMPNCYPQAVTTPATTNDFECRNYAYQNTKTSTSFKNLNSNNSFGGSNQAIDNLGQVTNYTAFTFVADKTNYLQNTRLPQPLTIPAGQQFAGLNAMEYVYTIYSTAAKPDPLNPSNPVQQSDAKTVLQMDFRSRIVPLFQFAVFYDGDLEMNSSANMTIGGRVHTNANLYVQPNTTSGAISTTFVGQISAVGSIYNRVDSAAPYNTGGVTNVVTVLPDCITGTCVQFPAYSSTNTNPLTSAQLNALGGRVSSGTYDPTLKRLETPPPGFLRKRNYYQSGAPLLNSNAGEYYAKADMRLEMVPDRDVTNKTATPWTRNQAIIPFNFTSITANVGTAGSCTTVLPPTDTLGSGMPTLASDPAPNYIASDRNNAANLRCNVFTKGQLQSLRQPVLVLTGTYQTTAALQLAERTTLASALGVPGPVILPAPAPFIAGNQARILRALQVAIASTPIPIPLDTMNKPFSDPAYAVAGSPSALFRANWTQVLTALLPAELANLTVTTISPNQIAAIGGAWFLPAPVQRIANSNPVAQIAANPNNSGFYDGRERRWVTMLQTNIASLSVWNRDSLWVDATNNNLTTAYATTPALQNAAFIGTTSANTTRGLAFDRVDATAVVPAPPANTLRSLGLGSIDTTEGGLVFHATVSDDLDGDGAMLAANDVSLDIANPIYKRDAPGNLVDASNNPISPPGLIIDYPRRYRNNATYQSPFGFAFNGGDFLPAPLTLVTDQAIYIQGNFNNNAAPQATSPATIAANPASPNRLPASIIGDTITILSNQCIANSSALSNVNHLGVPAGQLPCGLPRANTGSVNITNPAPVPTFYGVTGPTAVNAAFLSNTDRSNGDLGVGRNNGGPLRFSGAINNYMRMLENWGGGGQNFNYTGSFVSLGTPLEFSGAYVSGGGGNSYYGIPARNFSFDANFGAFNSLPPLPPQAIFLRQDVFKRTYN